MAALLLVLGCTLVTGSSSGHRADSSAATFAADTTTLGPPAVLPAVPSPPSGAARPVTGSAGAAAADAGGQTRAPAQNLVGTPPEPTYGCGPALSYLAEHAAPGFVFQCPGYSWGHQAMTCYNHPPQCPAGSKIIEIAVPCPAAYMNEAFNSWVIIGARQGAIDPYGFCH